jgi:alpha-tubulin suppressor-like RCC1 family protein
MIHILSFPSYSAFTSWFLDPSGDKAFDHHMLGGRAVALLAGATAFVMLTEEGETFSWGDGRHPACLGRVPGEESPAGKPGLIGALGGIRVVKIDGRGWAFGALSDSGDLYLWGRSKPGGESEEDALGSLFGGPDEEVKLLEGEMFEDVSDFAVGNGHGLVATPGGEVWGIGENGNGQLGRGTGDDGAVTAWTKVVTVEPGAKLELTTGDLSSFMVSDQELG